MAFHPTVDHSSFLIYYHVLQITTVFKDCLEALEKIAFVPTGDIYRFIDKEAMLVNQALLANQRAMNKLYVNLMEANLMQEMAERQKHNAKVQKLNAFKKNDILQKFREFLAKDWNAGLATEKEKLMKEQQKLNAKRIQRLEDIANVKPFDFNKTMLAEWYNSVRALNQEIDSLHIQYTSKLQAYYERLYRDWMTEIENVEEMLVSLEVCSKEEARQLIMSDFLPIVGNLQRQCENEQSTVDKQMENLAHEMDLQCKAIYNVSKEAIQLWEEHQLNLADHENQLKEQLDGCRKKHDKVNQAREANLDQLIDQLRQRNTEAELKSDHKKAICLLDGIRKGYVSFFQKQLKIVQNYPAMSEKELQRFSAVISKCFDVTEIYKSNKLKIKIEAPSPMEAIIYVCIICLFMALIAVNITYSEVSEIPDGSEGSQSIREEVTDQSAIIDTGEETVPLQQEQGPHIEGLSIETIHKQQKAGGSIHTNSFSEGESSPFTSQHLSDEESEGKLDSLLIRNQSDIVEETESASKFEYFRTSKGNTYTVISDTTQSASTSQITTLQIEQHLLDYVKHAFLAETTFLDLKKRMRVNVFELLEDWYDKAIENAKNIAMIKKKEFKAELDLRMHLHKPRGKRIKMDILHVRAVELRLHREKVERHCKGVDEALKTLQKDFKGLQSEHCKAILRFRDSIYNMEEIFKTANKSDRLVSLLNSLHSRQDKYMDSVNKLLRNFQNMMDKSQAKLRDDNTHFIKSFRLFAEGGNYTPQEISAYNEKVEQKATNIAKTEGTIMVDLEVMEALSLEQSTGVIKEVEDKFVRYTADLIFIEKIKRFLTNTQTRIKTEAALSNRQALDITSHLEQLERKIDACAHPNLDKEFVLPEELYHFAKIIRDLMEKRAIYLKCLVEPALTEVPFQGPIATATRVEFQTHESKVNETLLHPTRKGKSLIDDVAISVIKEILTSRKSETLVDTDAEQTEEQSTVRGSRLSSLSGSPNLRSVGMSSRAQKMASSASATKYSKINRFDAKYQVFEETAEESDHFKEIVKFILWENTNALLAAAEEYYRKKDRHQVYRPEYLKDNFEQCADELTQKMLMYQAQSGVYYNNCLQEFREQLKSFETFASFIPPFLINDVLKKQMEFITKALAEKCSTNGEKLKQLEKTKTDNKHKLRSTLGHPDNLKMLESLCREEEERQDTETAEIYSNAEDQKKCMLEHAEDFVVALSSLSEQLLLEFDNFLTADNVQTPPVEAANETTRQKRAGAQLQEMESNSTVGTAYEIRVWPGIPANEFSQICMENIAKVTAPTSTLPRETATVTTAKAVLADLATVEARDSAYATYKEYFLKEMSRIERETNGQLINAQHWRQGWRDSVANIKKLYALVQSSCIRPSLVLNT
ncbi:coiled-coil domain-containing protein 180-like [Mustelus asterias]